MTILDLDAKTTQLLVIDVQERLAPAMNAEHYGAMTANLGRLGAAMKILEVPVVVSEQYPKGLGSTVPPVASAFEGITPIAKTTFSCVQNDDLRVALADTGRKRVVVAGMETHICVFQTVRDLASAGYDVHVLADGVASRTAENRAIGLNLCERAGAVVTCTETVLFDLLGAAGSDEFKAISKLVK